MSGSLPLTAAELTDTRRFCGYAVPGALLMQDLTVQSSSNGLDTVLAGLSSTEVSVLRTIYLTNLYQLETDIVAARSDLDTNQAAVWKRNPQELAEKEQLYTDWRWRLCFFLGIAPGPGAIQLITSAPGSGGGSGKSGGSGSVGAMGVVPAVYTV